MPANQLGMTAILAMIVLYSFTLVAYFFFQHALNLVPYGADAEIDVCVTMIDVRRISPW